jgi:hypothetical protein
MPINPFHHLGNNQASNTQQLAKPENDQARDEMKTAKRKVSESDQRKANLFWFARATSELRG